MTLEPFTFVTKRIAIGGMMAYGRDLRRFGLRLNVAQELVGTTGTHQVGLDDQDSDRFCLFQAPKVQQAVEILKRCHNVLREWCLVTCAQGRNRSALVVAEFLIQEGAQSPETIIRDIQSQRKGALTNPSFVRWLCRKR